MENRNTTNQLRIVTLLLMLILAGCSTSTENNGGNSIVVSSVDCHIFYRATAGEGLTEAPLMSLSTNGDMEFVQFEELEFRAQFFADEFEGNSVSIAITNRNSQQELSRALYQIDHEKGLSNQFIGGHGFTGLMYVFHPSSDAELQYFCEAR